MSPTAPQRPVEPARLDDGDVGPTAVGKVIARDVDAALHAEARLNEQRIASVRVFAYGLVVLLDIGLWIAGKRAAINIPMSAAWLAASLALLAAIRFRFRPWMSFLAPVLDAVLIAAFLAGRIRTHGIYPGFDAVAAISCGLLAATGGLRLDARAAAFSVLLGGGLLVFLLGGDITVAGLLFCTCAILAIGLVSFWSSGLVRLSMEGRRGREFLGRFLPRPLVEGAFRDPMAFSRPRMVEATVLVTDVRGFTALAETLQPAQVLQRLSRLQGTLAKLVARHGGTVDKFLGDGMLAVFGAAEAQPDHAARALDCAADIQREVAALGARNPAMRFKIGIGVHTGPLVVGCLGAGDRLEFTVLGDTVNTASRLEALTKELKVDVLLGEATARLAGRAGLEDRGEVPIRGRQGKLRVFALRD